MPMSATAATLANTVTLTYRPRGATAQAFALRAPEVVQSGPAGTGKSRGNLEKLHLAMLKYPGARGLIVRKTRRSLTESAIVTWEKKVLHLLDGVVWKAAKQQYQYPNGSIVAVAGLDKPGKVMSSEWDLIIVIEATELNEADWEALSSRLRNGVMPYQQLLGDCNPDAPIHWLKRRADRDQVVMLESRHEDNPTLWDATAERWTPTGEQYIARLDALTGVRYLRLRLGIWAAAEGMVYQDSWDRARNLIDRTAVCKHTSLFGDCGLPRDWPRFMSIDFGFTHPFVAHWWAEDSDGRAYLYREIYMTHRLVEDHAATIKQYAQWGAKTGDPLPQRIFADHDAEDRATLERHLGLRTTAAYKSVSDGIQAVAARMRPAGDGRPRLCILRDSLIQVDQSLAEARQPYTTDQEIESYVWDERKEAPVKEKDHGMDAMRYYVATRDNRPGGASIGPRLF